MILGKVRVTYRGISKVAVVRRGVGRAVVAGKRGPSGGGNATHTGEVTGATALTADPTIISNRTTKGTPVAADEVLARDSVSGELRKITVGALTGTSPNPLNALSASAI